MPPAIKQLTKVKKVKQIKVNKEIYSTETKTIKL